MPVQSIPIGTPITLLANVVYALPAITVGIFALGPGMSISNTVDFLSSTAVPAGVLTSVSSGFIKSTTDVAITLKRD